MGRLLFVLLCLAALVSPALAESKNLPDRQIPAEVVTSLRLLEHTFERALAQDCATERCYSKGCVYISHNVVDQPASGSLPGLRLGAPGPGSGKSQTYLTTAECSFAHERSVSSSAARKLATRLQSKVSKGWTQVQVTAEKLQPLPDYLRESPEPPAEPDTDGDELDPELEQPKPEDLELAKPAKWEGAVAARELWTQLLPHFSWMIALVLLTFFGLILIWALRRLGRQSPEEQVLLAQMLAESTAPAPVEAPAAPTPEEIADEKTAEQIRSWRARFDQAEDTDPMLETLVSDLLRGGERRLLAKAVMLFPDHLPNAFPKAGRLASAKYELAEFLKTVDPATLPSNAVFFETLNRYALASSLTAQPDTELIRSLHADFGPTALVDLVGALPPRYGALLFALSPEAMQLEAVPLLTTQQGAQVADQLMRSNRLDRVESAYLLDVLSALSSSQAVPAPPQQIRISDRGTEFGATAALSVLMPRLPAEVRSQVVEAAAARLNGRLPNWLTGTLYGEMLLHLPVETRSDLLLQVEVAQLSSWLQLQTDASREQIMAEAPAALRGALMGHGAPASQTEHYALASSGRASLSAALQRRLLRGDLAFHTLLS